MKHSTRALEEELGRKTADQIVDHGIEAFERGDRATVALCIAVLESRDKKKPRAGAERLRILIGTLDVPANDAGAPPYVSAGPWQAFHDREIGVERLRLIRAARQSVWLSSLTFPSRDLSALLEQTARRIQEVRLIVKNRCLSNPRNAATVWHLEQVGVHLVNPKHNHSKLLVVDDRYTMNGSANAHWVQRDFCIVHDDPEIARAAKRYMATLKAMG